MKFDVVISSPPYNSKTGPWEEHVRKHLYLLSANSHYGLLIKEGTQSSLILQICQAFDVVMSSNYNQYIDGMPYKKRMDSFHCFIWKKTR